jgi:hypothetical protein
LLLFAFLVSVATGLLTGFAPALQAGRGSLMRSRTALALAPAVSGCVGRS